MYPWLRRPVPGMRVPRGDLLLALALTLATLWLAEAQVGDARQYHVEISSHRPDLPGPAPVVWPRPVAIEENHPDHLVAALNVAVTLPLAVRRLWPLAAFAVQVAGVFAAGATLTVLGMVALLIGAASMAAAARRPVLALGILTGVSAALAAWFVTSTPSIPSIPSAFAPFVVLLPVGLAGIAMRAARLRAEAYRQRAEVLARERDQATRAAVAKERARIARELHDVVSHHVSMMTIQAGAATKVLDSNPGLARGAMAAVESSGREAMGELRQLLGVLSPSAAEGGDTRTGAPPDTGEPLAPQPGLAQVPGLVESVRAAGQPVRADVPDGLVLPVATGLAAYRVVQEALTNALRYAPGARTRVTVEVDGDALVVDVSNEAPGAPSPGATGTGSGLVGLAERVRLCGGTLAARPTVGGGFTVRARMPLVQDVA